MLLTPAQGQGCADLILPPLLSSLSGYLLTLEDAWDEEENPQATISDTSEGEDSGHPSRIFRAENVVEPIRDFTDGLALDLKYKKGSDPGAEAE